MKSEKSRKVAILYAAAIGFVFFISGGCDAGRDVFTVGIAAWDTTSAKRHMDGFKDGMVQLNYVEGQNIEYIYETIPEDKMSDIQTIDAKLKRLYAQDLDLLLVVGQEVTVQAKRLFGETDLPILFSGTTWPVKFGFVESLGHPGGNMTGVRFANSVPKSFEWLASMGIAKKVYLPYNPDDEVSVLALKGLEEIADRMGVELVLDKIGSVEETAAAIEHLPGDIDAVYWIPSPTFDSRNNELNRAAIKRGLPTFAPLQLDDAVMATFGNDEYDLGGKLARLAHQIKMGAKPSELPVETAEVSLTINLKTAEEIGLELPNEILAQAKKIIRE